MKETSDLKESLLDKDFYAEVKPENVNMSKIFNEKYNNSEHNSEKYFKEHLRSLEYVCQLFRTDFKNGLSSSNKHDLSWREKKWGNNHLLPEKENLIEEQQINNNNLFEDIILKLLLTASIVTLIFGIYKNGIYTGWIEGAVILFAIFLIMPISSSNTEQETDESLKLSREMGKKNFIVIRDGREKEISNEEILVGDILKLRIGDIINVDGFVFGNAKVGMDESKITGESDVVWKISKFELKGQKYSCPFVLSGSQVVDGYGYMVVAVVGDNTLEAKKKEIINTNRNKGDQD